MRRLGVTLATLVLAVLGAQLAHALAYRVVEPSAHEREHALAETGHGYLGYASTGLALAAAVVLFALVLEIRASGAGRRARDPRFWAFAALAPTVFVFQEHLERWFHDGVFPLSAVFEATFLIGLALQLPFAVLAYALARVLLQVARSVGRRLARPRVRRREARPRWRPAGLELPLSETPLGRLGARAPPPLAV